MISRTYLTRGGNLKLRDTAAPDASHSLERDGFAIVTNVLSTDEINELHLELTHLFETTRPDVR